MQYRSAIGSNGLLSGTPGPRLRNRKRKKIEEQEVNGIRARKIIQKEAFTFWQTVFLTISSFLIILSLGLCMVFCYFPCFMAKGTSSTMMATKELKGVTMDTVEVSMFTLGVISVVRMLLVLAGNLTS